MRNDGQSRLGRLVRRAAVAAAAFTAVAGLAAGPASALDLTSRPQKPQPWWCWSQSCVDFSQEQCEGLGGQHWDVEVGIGWWGGCEFP